MFKVFNSLRLKRKSSSKKENKKSKSEPALGNKNVPCNNKIIYTSL